MLFSACGSGFFGAVFRCVCTSGTSRPRSQNVLLILAFALFSESFGRRNKSRDLLTCYILCHLFGRQRS